MSIPRQVLRLAEEADAQLKQMRDKANGNADPPPPEPPQPPAPPTPPPVAEDWKARHDVAAHRVSVLEGITKKQGEEIQGLHAQLKQLKGELDAAKAPPAKPEPDLTKYDPELLETVEHLVEKRMAGVKREVEETRADREKRQADEAKAREDDAKKRDFVEFMDEFVPGWRDDDNSPEFATYLTTVDPRTGQQAQVAYMDAFHRIDGRAMSRVFLHFRQTKAAKPAQPPSPPVVPPVAGRPEATDVPPGKIWAVAEIEAYYDDFAKGRLRQKGWDQKRIDETERDILAAYREGRVR